VSIGTGRPSDRQIQQAASGLQRRSLTPASVRKIKKAALDSEMAARQFRYIVETEWASGARGEYFRFSAGPNVGRVKLDEFGKLLDLERDTISYLEEDDVIRELDRCSDALVRCLLHRERLRMFQRPQLSPLEPGPLSQSD
jgi:hypothetical protein